MNIPVQEFVDRAVRMQEANSAMTPLFQKYGANEAPSMICIEAIDMAIKRGADVDGLKGGLAILMSFIDVMAALHKAKGENISGPKHNV